MNFLQKNILRFKPDIIFNKNIFPKIDSTLLEFAIKCGLNLKEIPEDRKEEFFKNSAYINEILKYPDDEFLNLIIENSDIIKNLNYPESKKKILEQINKLNISNVDDKQLKIIANIDGECVIKIIKEKPDFIKNMEKDYQLYFIENDVEGMVNVVKNSSLQIKDFPYSILNLPGIIQGLCEKDLKATLDFITNERDAVTKENRNLKNNFEVSFALEEVEKAIFSNPKKNVKYLGEISKAFPFFFNVLTERKKDILKKVVTDSNTVISDDFPWFIKTSEIIVNSLLNVKEVSQINNLKNTLDYNLRSPETFMKKIGKDFVEKLKEIGYIYHQNVTPKALVVDPEIILALIENNPYTIEELPSQELDVIKYTDESVHTRIMESLEKNNYVFSSKTPDFLFYGYPDALLDAYEFDYDNFNDIPQIYGCTEKEKTKFLKREYEIIKEHDPDLELLKIKNNYNGSNENMVYYLNPYLFEESLKRGFIKPPISEYRILKIPKVDLIAPFLRNYYIENNLNYGSNIYELFSNVKNEIIDNNEKSDLTEMSDNYKKTDYSDDFVININMTEDEIVSVLEEDSEAFFTSVKNNIYTLNYNNFHIFSDEQKKEIAKIYLKKYPETLKNFLGFGYSKNLPKEILHNPYIQYELLYKNPERRLEIDPIINEKIVKNEEIDSEVLKIFIQENRILTENSTKYEKSNKQIALISIEKDPGTIKYISSDLMLDKDIYEIILKKIKEGLYTIGEDTPIDFIRNNYEKLKKVDFFDIDNIIKSSPKLLKDGCSYREDILKLKNEVAYSLKDRIKNNEITEDEFIEYLKALKYDVNIFYNFNFDEYSDIVRDNPEIIKKIFKERILPSNIAGDNFKDIIIDEVKKEKSLFLDEDILMRCIKMSNKFRDYVQTERADLFPIIPNIYFDMNVIAVNTLQSSVRNGMLNISDEVRKEYFPSELFDFMIGKDLPEYTELVDKLIEKDPKNIFMMSSADKLQDQVLLERYQFLLESGKINYLMDDFKVPLFYDKNLMREYINALKVNPNLINKKNIYLPNILTEEEKNIVKEAIKSSLDSSKELPYNLKNSGEFYEEIINKNISFIKELPESSQDWKMVEKYFSINNIKYDENLPKYLKKYYRNSYKASGYPPISEFEKEFDHYFSNLIRQNPELTQKFYKEACKEGFIISENDAEAIKVSPELIINSIKNDSNFIYRIDKFGLQLTYDYYMNEIEKILLKDSNFKYNINIPGFLKNSELLYIDAIKKDLNNRKIFNEDQILFKEDNLTNIQEIFLKNNIYLNDTDIKGLRASTEYVLKSLENANEDNIQKIIDLIDFEKIKDTEKKKELYNMISKYIDEGLYNFSDNSNPQILMAPEIMRKVVLSDITKIKLLDLNQIELSREDQKLIYNIFKENEEKYSADKHFIEIMQKNPYFIMRNMLNDYTNIDNYNFNGFALDKDFVKEISQKLIKSNYKITDKTPKFLLLNNDFLINYIKKQESIENIPKKYVAKLFKSENLQENPEIYSIIKYTINLKTPFSKYLSFWGEESFIELSEEYGNLINYLDISKKYTKEEARIFLNEYLKQNIDLSADELYSFFKNLRLEIKEEDFSKYYQMGKSDKIIKYAIKQNPQLIARYTGENEEIIMLAKDILKEDSYLRNKNFASSTKLITALIEEKSPEYVKYYIGSDKNIINIALEKGLFENKDEKYIKDIFENLLLIRSSSEAIKYLIENYNPNYIEQYNGASEEVFEFALEKGYIPTLEALNKNYILARSKLLVKRAIQDDVYCNGFLYYEYSEKEKLEVAKQILGKDTYSKIFENEPKSENAIHTKKEEEFLKLTSIISDNYNGVNFLRLLNKDFIEEVGFDEWKKIVKYSFKNIQLKYLNNILKDSEATKKFLYFEKNIETFIKDDQALGVNRFLTIAKFYNQNSVLCNQLIERFKENNDLSEIEKINLQTLMNGKEDNETKITADTLKNLISIEQKKLAENPYVDRDDIYTFLFNMKENDIIDFLKITLNSKTIAQIRNRAKEDENIKLLTETNYIGTIVDIIENMKYNYTYEDFNTLKNTLANAPEEQIMQIREVFGNITEMARKFYEIEAQEELINIEELKNNPSICSEYNDVKVIDLSKTKHTFYAHVFSGMNFYSFFNTDKGKVTICVSPETDKHEAYYYNYDNEENIVMVFSEINKGSFIGSAPENMGSDGHINENDYEVKNTKSIYDQKSIRESYSAEGHAETLLYREGLIPTGLKINKLPPSDFQIDKLKKLQEEVRKIKGHENDELLFIYTDGRKNRTINYENIDTEKENDEKLYIKEKRIQALREKFFNIFDINSKDSEFLRGLSINQDDYTIIDNNIYSEVNLSKQEIETLKAAVKLEQIVHKDEPESIIKYKEVEDSEGKHLLIEELTDSRGLWHLKRKNGPFAKEATETLLKEFIVDHLICNYSVGNEDFVLNSHNIIQPNNKKGAFSEIDNFISKNGDPYTEMSYYYYRANSLFNSMSNGNNNVYRKIFENYINSPDGDKTIDKELFDEMLKTAQTISNIPTDEYMHVFTQVLENIDDLKERKQVEKLIKARKENIIEDTEEFIERIKGEREIAQNVEKIESTDTVALINDIHGNASALEELLNTCQEEEKNDVFVLGDMIGFGAESNKCIDILRKYSDKLNIRCILGNHELYSLMGTSSFRGLSETERDLTNQIRRELSAENRKFLESLPIVRKVQIDGKIVEFTHFPIKENFEDDYEMYERHGFNPNRLNKNNKADYIIYGHEHGTEHTSGDEVGEIRTKMVDGTRYVNLPSSGCVHGKNTTYSVLDIKDGKINITVVPISYDKEKNDRAIRKTKNPYPHFFGTNIHDTFEIEGYEK